MSGNGSALIILPWYFHSVLSESIGLLLFAFERGLNFLSPDSRDDISISKAFPDDNGAAGE